MSATTFAAEPPQGLSPYRVLGWGASALLHGGALAFLLYGVPATEPAPAAEVIALEMMAMPATPDVPVAEPAPTMEQAQAVAPEATNAALAPPPPAALTTPEPAAATPPPEPVTTVPPVEAAPPPPAETQQPVEQEVQPPVEPDVVPLEAIDIPPPPPAPPPPPVQARAPTPPPPPRATPRREAPSAPAQPMAVQRSEAPPGPVTATPTPAAPSAPSPGSTSSAAQVDYSSQVVAIINRGKRYPQRARLRRIEGLSRVHLSLGPDGQVLRAAIHTSSGDADLDEESLAVLRRVTLPPTPPGAANPMVLIASISFTLR